VEDLARAKAGMASLGEGGFERRALESGEVGPWGLRGHGISHFSKNLAGIRS
jgi:hypothetical protein